jgi:hypothetical protein
LKLVHKVEGDDQMAFKASEVVDHLFETCPEGGLCYLPSASHLIGDLLDYVDDEGLFPDPNRESRRTAKEFKKAVVVTTSNRPTRDKAAAGVQVATFAGESSVQ